MRDLRRRQQLERGRPARGREKAFTHRLVVDDMTEGLVTQFGRIEMQEHQRIAVADPDIHDRAGVGRERIPQSNPLQDTPAPRRNGGGAPVMLRRDHVRRVGAVHDRDLDPGRRQRVAQRHAGQPGPHDQRLDGVGLR